MPILRKLPAAWLAGSLAALLAGLLAGPLILYWAGEELAGAYADSAGMLGLWRSIYGDAAGFGGAGLVFLLGPLALFQIVWLAVAALRKTGR